MLHLLCNISTYCKIYVVPFMKYVDNFCRIICQYFYRVRVFSFFFFFEKIRLKSADVVYPVDSQACCENRPTIGHNYVDVLILASTLGEANTRRFIAMNHNASHDYKLRDFPRPPRSSITSVLLWEWISRYV